MNAAIPFPRLLERPARLLPMLLPGFPLLAAAQFDDRAYVEFLVCAGFMLLLGAVYTLVQFQVLPRTSPQTQKEAALLEPAWLLGLFAAEIGVLANGELPQFQPIVALIPSLVFLLMATMSFGSEFQYRTLASLLATPVDRTHVWRTKMRVLSAAILSQILVFVAALSPLGLNDASVMVNYLAFVGIAGLFAVLTCPLWSLLTRNAVAGLTFSVAVPGLAMALIYTTTERISPSIVYVVGVAYALVAPWWAFQRWRTLEAPDISEREITSLWNSSRTSASTETHKPLARWRALLGKELRIQAVTLISMATAGLLVLLKPYVPPSVASADLILLLASLFAVVTTLLAGATPIAEERRIGTHDGLILFPMPVWIQWGLKLAIGLTLTVVAILVLTQLLPINRNSPEEYLQLGILLVLFSYGFLASSTATSALRALLTGLACSGVVVALCYFIVGFGNSLLHIGPPGGTSAEFLDGASWLARAEATTAVAVEAARHRLVERTIPIFVDICIVVVALPGLIPLIFSYRNFRQSAGTPSRLVCQMLICVGIIFGAGASLLFGAHRLNQKGFELRWIQAARQQLDLEASLSPAQLRFRRHWASTPLSEAPQQVAFHLKTPIRNGPTTQFYQSVSLPLSPSNRVQVLRTADLPLDLWQELRAEAIAAGDSEVPSEPPSSASPTILIQSDQGIALPTLPGLSADLLKRYGLRVESQSSASTPSSNVIRGTAPKIAMPPEMRRRYGLEAIPPP